MGRLKTDTWERMLEQMEQEGVGFYLNGKKLRRGKLSEPAACGKRRYTCRILSWMRKESPPAKSGTNAVSKMVQTDTECRYEW
ncbi:MAG: hypothetical protein ACLU3U_10450 [Gallintestinimicrobium sp.]